MPKAVRFSRGSIIYFAGDKEAKIDTRIFILQSGVVTLVTRDPGTNTPTSEVVKAGEFFGVKSALGQFPREEEATASTDCVAIAMTVQEFETLVSTKKDVLLKMLRVFSHQLRMVHKKTESILNNNTFVDQISGMHAVAQSFYDDEQFRPCCDVCLKILTRFPTSSVKDQVAKLYAEAKTRYEKVLQLNKRNGGGTAPEITTDGNLKQFSLPAFSRFAKTFEPEQVIISEFEPGDCFYLIQSGEVQLVKTVNGTKKNLDILKPGEFFGEMAILDNSPRSATCMAKTKVEVLEFNKENFQSLITGQPQMAMILLKLFCKRIYDQKRRLKILLLKDLQAKIADVFVMLDEMNSNGSKINQTRDFSLTIADVAHWAGLSVEETHDEVMKLMENRKIEVYENKIRVMNINDMKRLAESRSITRN